ncbi:MAG TPA: NAD(P)-dependent oxidoreductase [Candidatus Angelobacter sp.]|jgi:3-hydroxyisobutyrate dehydrogenase-like beta-hydroxyacid dehydrogenase
MNIAFIGLGNMGSAMAANLLKAGHTLTVYNRSSARADALKPLGARVAAAPGEAAAGAEVAITMLADDHAVETVVFGKGNVLDSLPPNAIHVSMSTISVALSRRLAAAHAERKQHYLSAPVFGRPEAAAAAKLFIVAAGPAAQIEPCRPLFDAMGQKTFVAGDDASGANLMKLAGNFLITAVIEGLAESFALVRKAGLDVNQFHEILTNSLFNAPIYKTYGSIIATEKFEPAGFKLPLGLKDNRLLLAAAEEQAVPMPMASLVRDRFLAALAQGMGEQDWSAISRISAQNAGL